MSLSIDFEPHSYYMEFAIKNNRFINWSQQPDCINNWEAYTDDGNTYRIIKLEAATLRALKYKIREYYVRNGLDHAPVYYLRALRLHWTRTRVAA